MSRQKPSLSPTAGLIVTYHSDTLRLQGILSRLATQCSVVICDNSESPRQAHAISECVERIGVLYFWMGKNVGIARAQNIGIEYCWEHGAERVLLLDDDSMPCEEIVHKLEAALDRTGSGRVVVGARAVCGGRDISNVRTKSDLTVCRDLMSSGSLICKSVFALVGPFDERLFIDGVDFDWGWRAQSLGVRLYLSSDATIEHRLGIGRLKLGMFGIRIPASVRHYYQCRNVLILMRRRYTPWKWRLRQAFRVPIKLLFIAVASPERRERIGYAISGICDAIRGHTGSIGNER